MSAQDEERPHVAGEAHGGEADRVGRQRRHQPGALRAGQSDGRDQGAREIADEVGRGDQAGLRMCSAHGLRKLGATVAAELQATEHQLMAMFDWSTPQQAAVYTREARRKLLAHGAMPLLTILGAGLNPPSKGVH